MHDKKQPVKVKRNDIRFAHGFLLAHPAVALVIGVVMAFLGGAIAQDWLGHSAASSNWQAKNAIGAGIAGISSIILWAYAVAGFVRRLQS